jgi:NADP-dependent 3-hydroxy acid dehydrogenase YdfG
MDFTDKVIVITGSSKGFGKDLAKAFADKRAELIISSDDADSLSKTASELGVCSFLATSLRLVTYRL